MNGPDVFCEAARAESCLSLANYFNRGRHTSALLACIENDGDAMQFAQELADNFQPEPFVAFGG